MDQSNAKYEARSPSEHDKKDETTVFDENVMKYVHLITYLTGLWRITGIIATPQPPEILQYNHGPTTRPTTMTSKGRNLFRHLGKLNSSL